MEVSVTTFDNPFSFFYIPAKNVSEEVHLPNQAFSTSLIEKKIDLLDAEHGQYVAVNWDQKWLRGIVMYGKQITIWLIDLGIHIRPAFKTIILKLPKVYETFPSKVIEASIYGVAPHVTPFTFPMLGHWPTLIESEWVLIHHADPMRVGGCHMSFERFFGSRTCRFHHDVFLHRFEYVVLNDYCEIANDISNEWMPGVILTSNKMLRKAEKVTFTPIAIMSTDVNDVVIGDLHLEIPKIGTVSLVDELERWPMGLQKNMEYYFKNLSKIYDTSRRHQTSLNELTNIPRITPAVTQQELSNILKINEVKDE